MRFTSIELMYQVNGTQIDTIVLAQSESDKMWYILQPYGGYFTSLEELITNFRYSRFPSDALQKAIVKLREEITSRSQEIERYEKLLREQSNEPSNQ